MKVVKPSEPPTFSDSRWKTSGYRKQIVKAIEHAVSYCPQPLPENAYDLEHRAFQESDNKKQYLHKVQRIIHAIDKKTFSNGSMERNKDSNMSGNTDQGNDAPSTSGVCDSSSSHDGQKMTSRTYNRIKSRQLVLKSRHYLKPHRNPLQNASAMGKKKLLLSRFKMHKYLSSLITKEQERIVNKITVETVATDTECRLQNVHAMANTWKSKLCSFFAGLEDLDKEPVIPNYICDPLTNAILRDPVVAHSGITYEKTQIERYMERADYDPITHHKFRTNVLIPNHALKEVVTDFLNENEWALPSMESD